jgi:hypothetical protein
MKKIVWVIVVTGFFMLYLFQHRYSVSATQQIAQLEKQRQILKENITALESKQANTFLFINLNDSAREMSMRNIQPATIVENPVTKTSKPDQPKKILTPDTTKTQSQISAKINE